MFFSKTVVSTIWLDYLLLLVLICACSATVQTLLFLVGKTIVKRELWAYYLNRKWEAKDFEKVYHLLQAQKKSVVYTVKDSDVKWNTQTSMLNIFPVYYNIFLKTVLTLALKI